MRRLLILGSTGSIGSTCLKALSESKTDLEIVGLTAHNNQEKLNQLACFYSVPTLLTKNITKKDMEDFIHLTKPDITLNAVAGSDGLLWTLMLLKNKSDVALANKESIVMGGNYLLEFAKENNCKIIPVDSEHSAIYNLLKLGKKTTKLLITASGGPFLHKEDLTNVSVEDAINHPTWKMGKKISVDSATLANKGLEVIEASYLFNFDVKNIDVLIHPQSIVHSLIQVDSGEIYAQLSRPNMALPIMLSLTENKNCLINNILSPLDFTSLDLHFERLKEGKFPLFDLALKALTLGSSYPIAYNAANEEAVYLFLDHKIKFLDITKIVNFVLENSFDNKPNSYQEIISSHNKAKDLALNFYTSNF